MRSSSAATTSTARARARPSRSSASLDAEVLRGNCEDLAEEWERGELAPGDLDWLQSLPLAVTRRRRPLLSRGAGRQHSDHDGRDARRRGPADVRRSHRHDRDRAHAPSVRPARRRPARRQRGLGRHGVRGRRRGVLDAGRRRRADADAHAVRRRPGRRATTTAQRVGWARDAREAIVVDRARTCWQSAALQTASDEDAIAAYASSSRPEPVQWSADRQSVGRRPPHGIDGAFFVEQPSDDGRWWKTGATFLADGAAGRGGRAPPLVRAGP